MTTPPIDSVGTLVSRQLDKLSGRKRKVFTRREITETFGLVNSKMFSQLIRKRKKLNFPLSVGFLIKSVGLNFRPACVAIVSARTRLERLLHRLIFDFYYKLCLETPTVRAVVVLQSRASLHLS